MTSARAQVGALVVAAALILSACTSGGSASDANQSTPTEPTIVASDTIGATDSTLPTDTASATGTPATTTPVRSTATRPANTSCSMAALRLTALRGSGFQGREFAQILFTNKSTKSCTLFGFPGVSLRRAGALLGQPASREPVTPKTVTLRPGESATSDITDFSTCNAPRSDTVRVYPPDSKLFVDLPLDLRGCSISVRPVVHE